MMKPLYALVGAAVRLCEALSAALHPTTPAEPQRPPRTGSEALSEGPTRPLELYLVIVAAQGTDAAEWWYRTAYKPSTRPQNGPPNPRRPRPPV